MPKIALITDNHFGARGDSQLFDKFFRKFYEKIFFPILDQLKIKEVVGLGDTFDRRKFINYLSLSNCKDYFFQPLLDRGIKFHLNVGNHDTFYKNTNSINSPDLLLGEFSNIDIYANPGEFVVGGNCDALMVPWICPENQDETYDLLSNTKAQVVFGHLELAGFQMYRGHVNEGGASPSIYSRFEHVFSGHFHHRDTKGNITYLGNPYELTWSDYDDPRGFHIFDTDTRELTFIENPFRMFHKVFYDDTSAIDYLEMDVRPFHEKFIKVVVVNKTNFLTFDKFLDRLYNIHPAELKIVENMVDYDEEANTTEVIDVEDIGTMMENYVDTIETNLDKARFKSFLKTLHVEAKALQDAEA